MEVMGTFYKGICKWKSKGKNMLEVGPRETGRRGLNLGSTEILSSFYIKEQINRMWAQGKFGGGSYCC